jgi:hypothetical protein
LTPAVADARLLGLAPGRRLRTRLAGLFLFLPLLARLNWPRLIERAGYPGSDMIPASSALLSLLALKLVDKERRSHANDLSFDEAAGLFCGLNILPKKSFLTEYSYRTSRENQRSLLVGWVAGLQALLFPQADTFSLDFHPIPHRGEDPPLERHYVSSQGRARPSVLAFFALEQDRRALCYANANLTRAEQAGEPYRFVEFWHEVTGKDPAWLYFDSRVTTYEELSRLNQRQVQFITIRRRGSSLMRRLQELAAGAWHKAVIATPKRCHQHIRYVDEWVRLPGYAGRVRQVAVDGLGNEEPTLLLSNNAEQTARQLIIRYAGRNRVEDGLGSLVDFFHLDSLSSEVRLNADLDAVLTVLAHGCYRWLGQQIKGYESVRPKQLYRTFVETGGLIEVGEGGIVVTLDRRSHNPLLKEAALGQPSFPVPWLRQLPVLFCYS